jgi:hypothetical protein
VGEHFRSTEAGLLPARLRLLALLTDIKREKRATDYESAEKAG